MSFSTIKGKLTLLLAILIAGFGALGFEVLKLSDDGRMGAVRLTMIGEVDASFAQTMMELRAYYLVAQPSRYKAFEENFQKGLLSIDNLSPLLISKENQEKIASIKKNAQEWYRITQPLVDVMKLYGPKVNDSAFEKEHPQEHKQVLAVRQTSSKAFDTLMGEIDALLENVKKVNFDMLSNDKLYAEIILGVIFSAVIIIFFLITGSITKSVAKGKEGCELIRNSKDLSININIGTKDEINDIVQAVNEVIKDVSRAMGEAKGNAIENASVAEELSNTSLQIGKRAEEESNVVAQATRDANIVASEITDSSIQAQTVKTVTLQAQKSLSIAQDLLAQTIEQLGQTAQAEAQINDRLNHLASEAQQVRSVLDVIGDIADQTNLLALNAAIEAARAGEHGRGFAVVADEVRKLAERTQKSLVETNATINVIVQSIGDISGEMNINAKRVDGLSEFSDKVAIQTKDAVAILAQSVDAADVVVAKANSNVKLIESAVIQKIGAINELSSSNARSVEEIAGAAEHLSKLAGTLSNTLSQFKTA